MPGIRFGSFSGGRSERTGRTKRVQSRRLALELLEDRRLLAARLPQLPPPLLFDVPPAIVSGPNKEQALWFTDFTDDGHEDRIGVTSTTGVVAFFSDPANPHAHPIGITQGPDGALWFTEASGRGKIGRISIDGVITTFPLPTTPPNGFPTPGIVPGGQPTWITTGPDGNLWFTVDFVGPSEQITPSGIGDGIAPSQQIGQITPSGAVQEFDTGLPSGVTFNGITEGPDKAAWFADSEGVGRITTSGVVTLFNNGIPTGTSAQGITTGPDNNLWFTLNTGQIGRITTGGDLSLFSVGGSPLGITSGPDGALWFTQANGGQIGRITTSGTVTEFPSTLPAGGKLYGITSGPDGTLWFTATAPQLQTPRNPKKMPTALTQTGVIGQITTSGTAHLFPMLLPPSRTPPLVTQTFVKPKKKPKVKENATVENALPGKVTSHEAHAGAFDGTPAHPEAIGMPTPAMAGGWFPLGIRVRPV